MIFYKKKDSNICYRFLLDNCTFDNDISLMNEVLTFCYTFILNYCTFDYDILFIEGSDSLLQISFELLYLRL